MKFVFQIVAVRITMLSVCGARGLVHCIENSTQWSSKDGPRTLHPRQCNFVQTTPPVLALK